MKKYAMNEVTLMQYIFLIHGVQFATGILSLPRELAEKGGTDGWMSLLVGWILNLVASLLIVQILKKFPDHTLFDLLVRLFGKWISRIIALPWILFFAYSAWIIQIKGMLYTKAWFLSQTPDYIVMLLFAVPSYLIVRNGWRVLGRYSELVFYMTIWMPFILLFALKDSYWIHLFPLFKEGIMPIFQGLEPSIYSLLGFEITFFLYPFLQNKQMAARGIVIANTLTLFLYLLITLICFAFFSPDEITVYNQPVLNLLKVIEFRFIERFDMIFMALYLFIVSTAWIPYYFCACFCTSQLLGKQNHSPYVIVFALLFIVVTFLLHPSWNQSENWTTWMSRFGIGIAYIFPLLLWIYVQVYVRVRRGIKQ
ncbi:MAG: gerIB [Paenibacillus sp.]|jgi:spore germination protein (amino acid permease)|nr:gerIB [Paenibacillus sp.]